MTERRLTLVTVPKERRSRCAVVPCEALAAHDTSPASPKRVGKYRVIAELGSGGMGIVYLAQSRLGERVALKVIRPDLARNAEFAGGLPARQKLPPRSADRASRRSEPTPRDQPSVQGHQRALSPGNDFAETPASVKVSRRSHPRREISDTIAAR